MLAPFRPLVLAIAAAESRQLENKLGMEMRSGTFSEAVRLESPVQLNPIDERTLNDYFFFFNEPCCDLVRFPRRHRSEKGVRIDEDSCRSFKANDGGLTKGKSESERRRGPARRFVNVAIRPQRSEAVNWANILTARDVWTNSFV